MIFVIGFSGFFTWVCYFRYFVGLCVVRGWESGDFIMVLVYRGFILGIDFEVFFFYFWGFESGRS